MWYVIQVKTGTEEMICRQCRKVIEPEVLERCFLPRYKRKRRYWGTWHIEEKPLFPGYVFLVTDSLNRLWEDLRRVIGLTKLIRTGEDVIPLTEEEVAFLKKLGGEEQKVELSTGFIENDRVRILSGPLQGLESCIKRIDRHQRKAWLEIEMFGRTVETQVGLEIVEKV